MGPLDNHVLADDALRSAPDGFSLALRTPWYRSLPLAAVARLEIAIDGAPQPMDSGTLTLDGRCFRPADLQQLHDHWWFMLDDLVAQILTPEPLRRGSHYDVEVGLDLFIPYLLVGPDQTPLTARGDFATSLRCR